MSKEEIKEAVKEALQEELKDFYIDREDHYQQHQWLSDLIKTSNNCKGIIGKTVLGSFVMCIIGILAMGFGSWVISLMAGHK